MTPQEIQTSLTNEYNVFMRQPFPNFPRWALSFLPGAVMSLPQNAVPYHAERIKQILGKTAENLSIFEAGLCVNLLLACKPEVFEIGITEFLAKRIELEKVRDEYKVITDEETARLQRKKTALEGIGRPKNNNHLMKR